MSEETVIRQMEMNVDGKSLKALDLRDVLGEQADKMPFSKKVLLEQLLRKKDNKIVTDSHIKALISSVETTVDAVEIPFFPSRVVLQDFTGVPSLVDLAALRNAMVEKGGDPTKINPQVPVDLIIDHSVQVDTYGNDSSLNDNMNLEFERNAERYKFLKWGQGSFNNFNVFPPGAGIIHQVNLEYLARVAEERDGYLLPDSLVGTDSHTTMINGIGVLGWGVGGIEAESVMLGQPIYMKIPEVIGFKLTGKLPIGTTATDLVLRVTQMLREKGVVEKFVEFYGEGLAELNIADRATISNMAPEYGATVGYFPVDFQTLNYLQQTGRPESLIKKVEQYTKATGLFRTADTPDPLYNDSLELDLSSVKPAVAGPKRPQDRINLDDLKSSWANLLTAPIKERGFALAGDSLNAIGQIADTEQNLAHGSIVIAAITSCTNTSNPSVLLAAGLLAKKAREKGLETKPWVKTSLAPGSRVVTDYLDKAELTPHLNGLGFYTVGYGCTTCIGNSGPLNQEISDCIQQNNLVAASVLSGNRNFEGRIHADIKANFLASPPLVIAFAIAGKIGIDFEKEPIGFDFENNPVMLADIWPQQSEIEELLNTIKPEMYIERYKTIQDISDHWKSISSKASSVYDWNEKSTYIQHPPFFQNMPDALPAFENIKGARVLALLNDSVTTDHISPAGNFAEDTPAGNFLKNAGVEPKDFNTYGSRRGNDKVMHRGTFANVRIRNQLVPGVEGGYTRFLPENKEMSIFAASEKYKKNNTPLVIIAGKEYGTGSSRDWAAKGTFLLGVKAVIASSFERIHRSNLIGMGVLPLQFQEGTTWQSLGLTGEEVIEIMDIQKGLTPGQSLQVKADNKTFNVLCRLDTDIEVEYYRNGGILHTFLRNAIDQ